MPLFMAIERAERMTSPPSSPLKNATSRSSRGNEAQISSETEAISEPPHVGCYFLNRLLTIPDSRSRKSKNRRRPRARKKKSGFASAPFCCRPVPGRLLHFMEAVELHRVGDGDGHVRGHVRDL